MKFSDIVRLFVFPKSLFDLDYFVLVGIILVCADFSLGNTEFWRQSDAQIF